MNTDAITFWANCKNDIDPTDPTEAEKIEYEFIKDQSEKNIFDRMQQDEKQAKRQARLEQCGTYRYKFNPETRRPVSYCFRCGYMECPYCRQIEAQAESDRFNRAVRLYQDTWFFKVADTDNEKTVRDQINRLAKDGGGMVRFIPSEDGLYGYCNCDPRALGGLDNFAETTRFKPSDAGTEKTELGWNALCKLPMGKRKSGILGTPKTATTSAKVETDEETLAVRTPEFKLEGIDADGARNAYVKAMKRTKDLTPFVNGTVTELSMRRALRSWIDALTGQVKAQGGELIITRWVPTTVRINRIDWGYTGNMKHLHKEAVRLFPAKAFEQPAKAFEQIEIAPVLSPV